MVEVVGGRLQPLVGQRGATLEALQELTRLAIFRATGSPSRLLLDIGGYRATRRKELAAVARNAVEKVKEHGDAVRLEPMSAFERKCVHDVVNAISGVQSESEGVEPNRRIVVVRLTDPMTDPAIARVTSARAWSRPGRRRSRAAFPSRRHRALGSRHVAFAESPAGPLGGSSSAADSSPVGLFDRWVVRGPCPPPASAGAFAGAFALGRLAGRRSDRLELTPRPYRRSSPTPRGRRSATDCRWPRRTPNCWSPTASSAA